MIGTTLTEIREQIEHPVLATVVRLDSLCADCQRTVRDHLVRRA